MPEYVDVVIVGAGPSGSVVGAYLAKAGWKTVVLEATDRIGGPKYGGYDVNGFHADLTHIPYWSMRFNNGNGWWVKAAEEVGASIKFQCLPNNVFNIGGKVAKVPYCTNGVAFAEFFKTLAPFELPEETLDALAKVFDAATSLPEETLWSEEFDVTPASDFIDKIITDDIAKMLLGNLAGMMLCIPADISLTKVNCRMVIFSFLDALFGGRTNMTGIIDGACDAIPKGFCQVIEKHGGKVLLKHKVKQILVENNKAVGVVITKPDGKDETIFAKKVIIATEYSAYPSLLGDHLPDSIKNTIAAFDENAFMDIDVHYGLKKPIFSPGYSFMAFVSDEGSFQGLIASLPHFDPSQIPAGKQLLQLQMFKPVDVYKTKTVEEWTEEFLAVVEKSFPDVRENIEFKHETIVYQPFQYSFVPITKIPYSCPGIVNLYFVGDCTSAPSAVTDKACASGMIVAKQLLGLQ